MAKRPPNLDDLLRDWPYVAGDVSARLVRGSDAREVLQLRIDMGALQLEVNDRPDGARPGGARTYFDYLRALAIQEGDGFLLSEEQCSEADREFVQFYQRRICWLSLREFARAVRDADHSLAFMDFVRGCSPNEEWTLSHEQYRPFILFHRTQAVALADLDAHGPEAAIEQINQGLDRIKACFAQYDLEEQYDENELVERLVQLRQSLREHYHVGRTLREQLADAVASEQYELAARLRDELARQAPNLSEKTRKSNRPGKKGPA